jgi:hypothetical protein
MAPQGFSEAKAQKLWFFRASLTDQSNHSAKLEVLVSLDKKYF